MDDIQEAVKIAEESIIRSKVRLVISILSYTMGIMFLTLSPYKEFDLPLVIVTIVVSTLFMIAGVLGGITEGVNLHNAYAITLLKEMVDNMEDEDERTDG